MQSSGCTSTRKNRLGCSSQLSYDARARATTTAAAAATARAGLERRARAARDVGVLTVAWVEGADGAGADGAGMGVIVGAAAAAGTVDHSAEAVVCG
jgi:hypothetical protein